MSTWNAETKHKLNETLGIKYALASPIEFTLPIEATNLIYYYVFHGCVTLFFATNFLAQCRITMKFLHNFF